MANYFIELGELKTLGIPPILFFAEGPSEVGLINSYLTRLGADEHSIKILCFKGASKMPSFVRTFLKTIAPSQSELATIEGIGLIADSETDPSARIDSVIQCAKLFGFDGGGKELRERFRCKKGDRRFAFSLSPGEKVTGRIEDLVIDEVRKNELFGCIELSVPCIEATTGRGLDRKALVQMYISAMANTSISGVKYAFENGIFDVSDDVYQHHRATIDLILNGF
jgi:hypothetical protein